MYVYIHTHTCVYLDISEPYLLHKTCMYTSTRIYIYIHPHTYIAGVCICVGMYICVYLDIGEPRVLHKTFHLLTEESTEGGYELGGCVETLHISISEITYVHIASLHIYINFNITCIHQLQHYIYTSTWWLC